MIVAVQYTVDGEPVTEIRNISEEGLLQILQVMEDTRVTNG